MAQALELSSSEIVELLGLERQVGEEILAVLQRHSVESINISRLHDHLMKQSRRPMHVEHFGEIQYLSAGGQGRVFRSEYKSNKVVLKQSVLLQNQSKFWSELWTQTTLGHSHLLPVYGIVYGRITMDYNKNRFVLTADNNSPLLVTEYCVNGTLSGLYRKNILTEELLVRMVQEVAKVMALIHDAGIVHQDLKPANIFISQDNRVRVGDFGLADVLVNAVANATDPNAVLASGMLPGNKVGGTLYYQSPESLRRESVTKKTDVYSFGMLLFDAFFFMDEQRLFNHMQVLEYADSSECDVCMLLHSGLKNFLSEGHRPAFPDSASLPLQLRRRTQFTIESLVRRCWEAEPTARPNFTHVANELEMLYKYLSKQFACIKCKSTGFLEDEGISCSRDHFICSNCLSSFVGLLSVVTDQVDPQHQQLPHCLECLAKRSTWTPYSLEALVSRVDQMQLQLYFHPGRTVLVSYGYLRHANPNPEIQETIASPYELLRNYYISQLPPCRWDPGELYQCLSQYQDSVLTLSKFFEQIVRLFPILLIGREEVAWVAFSLVLNALSNEDKRNRFHIRYLLCRRQFRECSDQINARNEESDQPLCLDCEAEQLTSGRRRLCATKFAFPYQSAPALCGRYSQGTSKRSKRCYIHYCLSCGGANIVQPAKPHEVQFDIAPSCRTYFLGEPQRCINVQCKADLWTPSFAKHAVLKFYDDTNLSCKTCSEGTLLLFDRVAHILCDPFLQSRHSSEAVCFAKAVAWHHSAETAIALVKWIDGYFPLHAVHWCTMSSDLAVKLFPRLFGADPSVAPVREQLLHALYFRMHYNPRPNSLNHWMRLRQYYNEEQMQIFLKQFPGTELSAACIAILHSTLNWASIIGNCKLEFLHSVLRLFGNISPLELRAAAEFWVAEHSHQHEEEVETGRLGSALVRALVDDIRRMKVQESVGKVNWSSLYPPLRRFVCPTLAGMEWNRDNGELTVLQDCALSPDIFPAFYADEHLGYENWSVAVEIVAAPSNTRWELSIGVIRAHLVTPTMTKLGATESFVGWTCHSDNNRGPSVVFHRELADVSQPQSDFKYQKGKKIQLASVITLAVDVQRSMMICGIFAKNSLVATYQEHVSSISTGDWTFALTLTPGCKVRLLSADSAATRIDAVLGQISATTLASRMSTLRNVVSAPTSHNTSMYASDPRLQLLSPTRWAQNHSRDSSFESSFLSPNSRLDSYDSFSRQDRSDSGIDTTADNTPRVERVAEAAPDTRILGPRDFVDEISCSPSALTLDDVFPPLVSNEVTNKRIVSEMLIASRALLRHLRDIYIARRPGTSTGIFSSSDVITYAQRWENEYCREYHEHPTSPLFLCSSNARGTEDFQAGVLGFLYHQWWIDEVLGLFDHTLRCGPWWTSHRSEQSRTFDFLLCAVCWFSQCRDSVWFDSERQSRRVEWYQKERCADAIAQRSGEFADVDIMEIMLEQAARDLRDPIKLNEASVHLNIPTFEDSILQAHDQEGAETGTTTTAASSTSPSQHHWSSMWNLRASAFLFMSCYSDQMQSYYLRTDPISSSSDDGAIWAPHCLCLPRHKDICPHESEYCKRHWKHYQNKQRWSTPQHPRTNMQSFFTVGTPVARQTSWSTAERDRRTVRDRDLDVLLLSPQGIPRVQNRRCTSAPVDGPPPPSTPSQTTHFPYVQLGSGRRGRSPITLPVSRSVASLDGMVPSESIQTPQPRNGVALQPFSMDCEDEDDEEDDNDELDISVVSMDSNGVPDLDVSWNK